MARSVEKVGVGLWLLVSACGGSSKPPPDADGGATSTGGVGATGGTGASPSGGKAGAPGNGGAAVGGTSVGEGGNTCEGCAGESSVELVCEPHTQVCEDNRVMACKADGSGTVLAGDCGAFYHCVQSNITAQCEPNACSPGDVVCDGNLVKTCTEGGTLPAAGEDCGDEVCEDGACVPQVCEPSTRYCKGNVIYECSANGAQEAPWVECDARSTCQEREEAADCVALACEPEKAACIGEISGACAEDGLSLASTSTDCGASNKICDLATGCVNTATDTLGKKQEVEAVSGGELVTNMLDVHSARTLLEIEANWLLEQPRDLRFVVYEWTNDQFEVRYDEITSNHNGSGFFSSGPMNIALEAGKRYLIGAGLVVGEGYAYYDATGWTGITSFAGALGGARFGRADTVGVGRSDSLYVLRLKTASP